MRAGRRRPVIPDAARKGPPATLDTSFCCLPSVKTHRPPGGAARTWYTRAAVACGLRVEPRARSRLNARPSELLQWYGRGRTSVSRRDGAFPGVVPGVRFAAPRGEAGRFRSERRSVGLPATDDWTAWNATRCGRRSSTCSTSAAPDERSSRSLPGEPVALVCNKLGGPRDRNTLQCR